MTLPVKFLKRSPQERSESSSARESSGPSKGTVATSFVGLSASPQQFTHPQPKSRAFNAYIQLTVEAGGALSWPSSDMVPRPWDSVSDSQQPHISYGKCTSCSRDRSFADLETMGGRNMKLTGKQWGLRDGHVRVLQPMTLRILSYSSLDNIY